MKEEFILKKEEIKQLIDWTGKGPSGCIASNKITKEGWKVGYMYREEPTVGFSDSGWVFLKGDEDEEYMSNPHNHHVFDLNTICNYDMDIIPHLDNPIGTILFRDSDNKFKIDERTKPIHMVKRESRKE